MCITPISGTRALILSQHGNQPYSEEINSTRGLLSTLEIIGNRMGGGRGGWGVGGRRTTFDLANNKLIPGVTHVSIQKTPFFPSLFALVFRVSRLCVFFFYLLSFECVRSMIRSVTEGRRCSCAPLAPTSLR